MPEADWGRNPGKFHICQAINTCMGGTTPVKIKQKAINYWLSGLTRDDIAKKLGISEGNVSLIVQQAKENFPDIELLRELAVRLKKQGFKLDVFASAYSHRSLLQTRGLNDDQIDDMIQHIDEHCYQRGIEVKTFIQRIDKTSLFSDKYACPIEELEELKLEKEAEIVQLDYKLQNKRKELQDIESSRHTALAKAGLTEQDISDYKQNEPLLEKIRILEDKVEETFVRFINLKVIANMRESSGASLINPVTLEIIDKQVVKACFLLARNPLQFRREINYINKQEPKLPFKAGYIPDIQDERLVDIATF
jgi:transcriptional regulator with XRE-family HTH domain